MDVLSCLLALWVDASMCVLFFQGDDTKTREVMVASGVHTLFEWGGTQSASAELNCG